MGAVAILLNYDFSEEQIKDIIESEKPDAIFVSDYKLNYVLGADSTILAIDDNRLLKQVSRQVKNSISTVEEKDNAVVIFDKTENGNFVKKVLTQKSFIELTEENKKTSSNVSMNTIIDSLKSLIFPIFKGLTVNTSI